MSTLLSSSCIKMSRASQPQHALLLITLSREGSSFRLVNWSTERKNRAKTNMCSWVGTEKLLSTLAIATSWGVTYLQCKIPFAALGLRAAGLMAGPERSWVCDSWVPEEHLPQSINSAATTIPLWKALTKTTGHWIFRSCWLLGSKGKTFIFLFPVLRRSLDVCSYHPYWAHDLKYFSLVRPSWELLWNCSSSIQASLGSSAKFAMAVQEHQWRNPDEKPWSSPGPTRVILFIFHCVFSWMMQNMKMSSPDHFCFPGCSWSSGIVLGMKTFLLTVLKVVANFTQLWSRTLSLRSGHSDYTVKDSFLSATPMAVIYTYLCRFYALPNILTGPWSLLQGLSTFIPKIASPQSILGVAFKGWWFFLDLRVSHTVYMKDTSLNMVQ